MSQPRVVMIWTGAILALAGLVLIVLRLIGAHEGLPVVAALAVLPYFGAASGLGIIGLTLVLLAPKDRRKTRRVRLDQAPVQENTTLRPARHHGIPTTSGFQDDTKVRRAIDPKPSAPRAPAAARPSGPSAPAAMAESDAIGLPGTSGIPTPPPARSQWGKPRAAEASEAPRRGHPNSAMLEEPEAIADAPADAAAATPRPQTTNGHAAKPRRQITGFDASETAARQQSRRIELVSRLEELEQKANQAKVRYGLGKVSAAGYRQYLAEVDRERMMIESELMEAEE